MSDLQTITKKEKAVLLAITESQYQDSDDCDQIDYPVWQFDVLDCAEGVGARSFPGVVSSLTKKGLVSSDSTDKNKNEHFISLTAAGFDLISQEDQEDQEETITKTINNTITQDKDLLPFLKDERLDQFKIEKITLNEKTLFIKSEIAFSFEWAVYIAVKLVELGHTIDKVNFKTNL